MYWYMFKGQSCYYFTYGSYGSVDKDKNHLFRALVALVYASNWCVFSLHSSFEDSRTTLTVNLRGEAKDTVSCKTYALNIRAVKLVKLKAILENRKSEIYASGSG